MPRLARLSAGTSLLLAAVVLAAPAAEAHGRNRHHGWHHHHSHHHALRHHRRLALHDGGLRWQTASPLGWLHGCGHYRFVTYYGSLAYREVCP